jgi:hypothetical protein
VAQRVEAIAYAVTRAPEREHSLRVALREYLAALDRGHLHEAELLARCTLGAASGPVTLLMPLVPRPMRGRVLNPRPPT